MSGSATLNGCGYTGIVNAIANLDNSTNAIVIPATRIISCLDTYFDDLKDATNCPDTTTIDAPKLHLDCDTF